MVAFSNDDIIRLYEENDEPALKVVLFELKDSEVEELIEYCKNESAKLYFEDYLKRRQSFIQIF